MESATILVVDDEPQTVRLLSANLKASGYRVMAASDGLEALKVVNEQPVDLVLLDIGIPGPDGFEVCRRIRETTAVLVIMVSARGRESDKVKALDLGAHDYLTKPFGMGELLARVRAVLRRSSEATNVGKSTVAWDDFVLDFSRRTLTRSGSRIHLTATEFKLLAYLVKNAGRILTHQALLREAWGAEYISDSGYLWTYIRRLRNKIEPDPQHPRRLIAEYGAGYRFSL